MHLYVIVWLGLVLFNSFQTEIATTTQKRRETKTFFLQKQKLKAQEWPTTTTLHLFQIQAKQNN